MYLEFFESKGHLKMNSFSLVPHNDNSLLLINAGMAPLKPYFTGQEIPPRRRVTTCQKCIRTGDIENVGKTARHGTFFEMLGNFSFGDYFKEEAIQWTWEFLTEVVGLDPDRLYPSVYVDDDEAFEIWNKKIGIPADRIFKFGKEDNSGSMAQVRAVRVLRYITTGEKNTDAANRTVLWDVTATGIWKSGMMCSPSLTMTETEITASSSRKTLIREWGWSVWHLLFRMWILFLMWIRLKRSAIMCANLPEKNMAKTTMLMCLSV